MARALLQDDATFTVNETELALDIAPDPDVVYTLRPLSTSAIRAIGKKHTRQEFSPQTHRRESVVDGEGIHDATLDYVIADWSGVGADGHAPCTLENKLKLPLPIQKALMERAQAGDSAEVRAESFRQPARVVSVLAR